MTEVKKPVIPEAAGRIHGILDFVEGEGIDPETQALLDSVRDRVNALTPETRPYFSPKEEAARIDLFEILNAIPNKDAEYKKGTTVADAIQHLERRTEQGLELTRLHMKVMRLQTRESEVAEG